MKRWLMVPGAAILLAVAGTGELWGFLTNSVDSSANELGAASTFVGSWSSMAPHPTALSGAAAAALGGLLYVAGGHDGTSDSSGLHAFSPSSGTWTLLTSMPAPRFGGSGGGTINGRMYIPGGFALSDGLPQTTLFEFDSATGIWATKAIMPTRNGCGVSDAIFGKLYVTTGCDGTAGYRDFLHVYDPATNEWTVLPPSPIAHANGSGAAIEGKLYVVGGLDAGGQPNGQLDAYDPATNQWTTLASLPAPRDSAAAFALGDKLYVIGGRIASSPTSDVTVYSRISDAWRSEAPLPDSRMQLVAETVGGFAYAVGGQNQTAVVAENQRFTP